MERKNTTDLKEVKNYDGETDEEIVESNEDDELFDEGIKNIIAKVAVFLIASIAGSAIFAIILCSFFELGDYTSSFYEFMATSVSAGVLLSSVFTAIVEYVNKRIVK